MLPHRLRLSRGRGALTGKEMRAASPHFSVSARSDASGSAAIVSKKTAPSSVARHRLKRRILATISPWCGPECSVVVHARKGSQALPFPVLKQELETLLTKLLGSRGVR